MRGWLHAGIELVSSAEQALIQSSKGIGTDAVAHQLGAAASFFTMVLGFPEEGVSRAKESLEWLQQNGNQDQLTFPLLTIGVGNNFLQAPMEAIAAAQELSELGASIGSKWWETRGKTIASGQHMVLGNPEQAQQLLDEYEQLLPENPGPWNAFWGMQLDARLAETRGDLESAREINQSIINSLQPVSFLRGMLYAYTNLGRIGLLLNELEEAEYNYSLGLQISRDTGQMRDTLAILTSMVRVWSMQGKTIEAVEVASAVLHHPQIDQATLMIRASIRDEAEAVRAELEQELGPQDYRAAWERGATQEVEDVVARILTVQKVVH